MSAQDLALVHAASDDLPGCLTAAQSVSGKRAEELE